MIKIRIIYFLIFFLALAAKSAFGQLVAFTPRENAMFSSLNQLQEKEDAIDNSMNNVQLRNNNTILPRRVKESGFRAPAVLRTIARNAHPYIGVGIKFDDNPVAIPEKKSDMIFETTPGVKLNFYAPGKAINLNFNADNTTFQHTTAYGKTLYTADSLFNFSLGKGLLAIDENATYNQCYQQEGGSISESNDPVDTSVTSDALYNYYKNNFTLQFSRAFNRLSYDLKYLRKDYFYSHGDRVGNNLGGNNFVFNQYLDITKKTRFTVQYAYNNNNYNPKPTPSKNYISNDFALVASTVLSPKISAQLKFDYNKQLNKNTEDFTDRTLATFLSYQLSKNTNFSLAYKRLWHKTSMIEDLRNENDLIISGNHRLSFNPKFNLSFSYEAEYNHYPKNLVIAQSDHIYRSGCGLSYAFRTWMDLSLNYRYKDYLSNIDPSYNDNQVTLRVDARF